MVLLPSSHQLPTSEVLRCRGYCCAPIPPQFTSFTLLVTPAVHTPPPPPLVSLQSQAFSIYIMIGMDKEFPSPQAWTTLTASWVVFLSLMSPPF